MVLEPTLAVAQEPIIHAVYPAGNRLGLVGDGTVDGIWRLLNSDKEHLVISGIASEAIYSEFRGNRPKTIGFRKEDQ
jgi:hypothetical protein